MSLAEMIIGSRHRRPSAEARRIVPERCVYDFSMGIDGTTQGVP